jgi:MFS family permease
MHKIYKILLTTSFIANFAEGLFLPIYAIYAETLGGDVLSISIAYAIYCGICGILFIFTGKFIDKMKTKENMLIVAYFMYALSSIFYMVITNPIQLYLVEILFGASVALQQPAWTYFLTTYISKEELGLEYGYMKGGMYIITGFAIIVGGFIVSMWGFDTLFIIMAMIQTGIAISLWIRRPFEFEWYDVSSE